MFARNGSPRIIGALFWGLLLTVCQSVHAATVLNEKETSDLRRMIEVAPAGQPTELDFSDPVAYRFYKRQLELAGITAKKFPEQFRVLEQSRQKHIASGAPGVKRPLLAASGEGDVITPIQTITSFGTANGTNFAVSALSSVPNQPYVSQLTVGLYDANMQPIGTPQYAQQYRAGEDLDIDATGTTTAGSVVIAVATYFWQDPNGGAHHGYIRAATSTAPTNITNNAPMPGTGQSVIKLCLGRSGTDCTYIPSGGSGSNVLMPVKGSITFPVNIDTNPSTPNFSLITMSRPDAGEGGGCTIASTSNFFDPKYTRISGSTISWDLAPAQFQPANGCLTPNSKAIYTFTVGLTVQSVPVYVSITSDPNAPPQDPYFKKIPDLYVFFSCLAQGTEVTMANGGTKKIETVWPGDKVLTGADGKVMAVDSKLKGTEEIPMIRLKTRDGHSLLLTDGHPVATPQGIVLARMLAAGDQVVTRNGAATLASVEREMFGGFVWNLNVGPRQENFSKLADNTTFFANGILVGDNQMQFAHNRKHKYRPESVQKALPERWRKDHQSYIAVASRRLVPVRSPKQE